MRTRLVNCALLAIVATGCGNGEVINQGFDVPSLLGKDINEIRGIMGKPIERPIDKDLAAESRSGHPTIGWIRDEQLLEVTYDADTGRVISFFMPGRDGKLILQKAGIEDADSRFAVWQVQSLEESADGSKVPIAGFTIVPQSEK